MLIFMGALAVQSLRLLDCEERKGLYEYAMRKHRDLSTYSLVRYEGTSRVTSVIFERFLCNN